MVYATGLDASVVDKKETCNLGHVYQTVKPCLALDTGRGVLCVCAYVLYCFPGGLIVLLQLSELCTLTRGTKVYDSHKIIWNLGSLCMVMVATIIEYTVGVQRSDERTKLSTLAQDRIVVDSTQSIPGQGSSQSIKDGCTTLLLGAISIWCGHKKQ